MCVYIYHRGEETHKYIASEELGTSGDYRVTSYLHRSGRILCFVTAEIRVVIFIFDEIDICMMLRIAAICKTCRVDCIKACMYTSMLQICISFDFTNGYPGT